MCDRVQFRSSLKQNMWNNIHVIILWMRRVRKGQYHYTASADIYMSLSARLLTCRNGLPTQHEDAFCGEANLLEVSVTVWASEALQAQLTTNSSDILCGRSGSCCDHPRPRGFLVELPCRRRPSQKHLPGIRRDCLAVHKGRRPLAQRRVLGTCSSPPAHALQHLLVTRRTFSSAPALHLQNVLTRTCSSPPARATRHLIVTPYSALVFFARARSTGPASGDHLLNLKRRRERP